MMETTLQFTPGLGQSPNENEKADVFAHLEAQGTTVIKPTSLTQDHSESNFTEKVPNPKPIKLTPPPLLILDLNGCILYREYVPGAAKIIHPRPYLDELFQYALSKHSKSTHLENSKPIQNWEIMIWSSAQPNNVATMCAAIKVSKRPHAVNRRRREPKDVTNQLDDISSGLNSLQINKADPMDPRKSGPIAREVVEIWDRSTLDLSSEDYTRKVATTKDLRKVWDSFSWTDPNTGEKHKWGPHNTVIVDDSPDKLSLQPDNLFMVNEYKGEANDKALEALIDTLKSVRNQPDIPHAMKKSKKPLAELVN